MTSRWTKSDQAKINHRMPTIGVRFDREDLDELRARAKRQGMRVTQLIRQYVEWGMEAEDAAAG